MKHLFILCLVFLSAKTVHAQQLVNNGGSRAAGLGGVMTQDPDGPWNVAHNPAGLVNAENFSAGLHASHRHNIDGLYNGNLAISIPVSEYDAAGIAFSGFAHKHYHIEQNARIAYGRKLTHYLQAGIHLDYFRRQLYIAPSQNMFTGGAGTIVHLNERFQSGIYVYNPFGFMAEAESSLIPHSRFAVSAVYTFSESLQSHFHTQKQSGKPVQWGTAISYSPVQRLTLFKGIRIQPYVNTFSVEFLLFDLRIGLAFVWHPYLGFSYESSLDYISNQ